jgi:hypothetical protein
MKYLQIKCYDSSEGRGKNMKIGIILGTKPEIIKMRPIIKECENSNINEILGINFLPTPIYRNVATVLAFQKLFEHV